MAMIAASPPIASSGFPDLASVSGMTMTVTEFGERDPGDEERDIRASELALLDDREGDRGRAAGDDHRDERRMAHCERVVEQQSDGDSGDCHDRKRKHAASKALADCR